MSVVCGIYPTWIKIFFYEKYLPARLLYNDFAFATLNIYLHTYLGIYKIQFGAFLHTRIDSHGFHSYVLNWLQKHGLAHWVWTSDA